MRFRGTELDLSATDLSNFLGCRHRTALDMAVARGQRGRPHTFDDPLVDILRQRGIDHERRYVDTLQAQGLGVIDLREYGNDRDEHVSRTLGAMRAGTDVIVQGALRDGLWFGLPDVLRRTPKPCGLGAWSYQVIDTKLSRETKAGTILQLGLYSDMLRAASGVAPDQFFVVTPYAEEEYRLNDFAAYFRLVRKQILGVVDLDPQELAAANYPDPVLHCDTCRWSHTCDVKRHQDDHLSLVAGISRSQRRELESRDVTTLAALARIPLPIDFKPNRGSAESYERVREQARIQLESRGKEPPLFELRAIVETKDEGLCRLPEPSVGDVFLDLEGDPFAGNPDAGGREYLFGLVTVNDGKPAYQAFWGMTAQDEKQSFESVMDLLMARWEAHPDMHIYHYAPYEPSAFKRLMGRYVTRGRELDSLLRNRKFVDLYGVIRQGMRVGTEKYSIKNLEPLYAFARTVQLADANRCLRIMEHALEVNDPDRVPEEVREAVRGYNEDDCVSTFRLRNWLEDVRTEWIGKGWEIPRPVLLDEAVEPPSEREQQVEALRAQLTQGVGETRQERPPEQQARWLLAYLLDYHRRENKAVWWEYFRLRELPEEELQDEPQAIAGLTFVERVHINTSKKGKPTGPVTDRYRFPAQEMEVTGGDVHTRDAKFGEVVAVDRHALTIDILKGKKQADLHPTSVFAHTFVSSEAQEASILAIAGRVLQDGSLDRDKSLLDRVGRALLLALPPVLKSGAFRPVSGDMAENLKKTVLDLEESILAVQGPPGAGKTYAGAEMIVTLVAAGKKVGVTAFSHKAIRNLLDAVVEASDRHSIHISVGQRCNEEDYAPSDRIVRLGDNPDAAKALLEREAQVVGGTSWLWSNEKLADSIDVLFVDEAGQMALANVLAMSPATKSIVLLGDPQQLEQPRKGTHPDGVGVSALDHLLGESRTIPPDRGVFLPLTWRMSPSITAFTSEVFYESRLNSKPGLEKQRLTGTGPFDGNGMWLVQAQHDGNRTSSQEEIDIVGSLVDRLLTAGATWTDEDGKQSTLNGPDVLVVAPYNAQVSRLAERLGPKGVRVGTVDKFQGQEAPVVIYSMATSRPEDAPRGMEFLYSGNRLNVATSRARCATIIVANNRLFEPECRAPRQMKLANAFCRYRELATPIEV